MNKVLIVEDNPTIIKLLRHFFQSEGYDVRLAENGLLALTVLESYRPDMIITDIIMPKISGDVLCRVIRSIPKFKDIFIVIYSAIASEDEKFIFDLEADYYIAKGSTETLKRQLLLAVEQFRGGKRRELIIHGKENLIPRGITRELLQSRRHYNAMMENLADAVIEMNGTGQIVQANKAALKLLAMDKASLLSTRLTEYLTGKESNLVKQWFGKVASKRLPQFSSSYDTPLMVGEHKVLLKLVSTIENDELFIVAILQDITAQKQTENKLITKVHEFNAVMESIEYGVLFMDSDLKARLTNRAFRDMWGVPDEFFSEQPTLRDLINFNRYNEVYDVPEDTFDSYLDERDKATRIGSSDPKENYLKDGRVLQYNCVILPDGGRMLTYFDITQHKNTQAQLAKTLEEVQTLANKDPLTDLYNHRMLQERFFGILAISKRKDWKAALMFIDLDGFKEVNDLYGHNAGDIVLKMVAQRLLKIVRSADSVCRIGGDEFLLIQTEVYQTEDVAHVAEKILQQLNDPFELDGEKISIGASIGIAIFPDDGNNLEDLIKKADNAMYRTKSRGKHNYTFFSTSSSR